MRSDARQNVERLLEAARGVFLTEGVDAPVKAITERAGVGVGTLYRHFPQRSDLIRAVFQREIDECAAAAADLAAAHPPAEALAAWLRRYASFIQTKRGFAEALHSGDPAYDSLQRHFEERLNPALEALLATAVAAGEVRGDVNPEDLLYAVAALAVPYRDGPAWTERMLALLVEGMRSR